MVDNPIRIWRLFNNFVTDEDYFSLPGSILSAPLPSLFLICVVGGFMQRDSGNKEIGPQSAPFSPQLTFSCILNLCWTEIQDGDDFLSDFIRED